LRCLSMAISTVGANILLGWMERDEAIAYLQNECCFDPPLTYEQAEARWNEYRNRVDALPERDITPLERHPIPEAQRQLVNTFKARFRGDPEIIDVLNIDPMKLLAYQFYVVTDRAEHHVRQAADWARKFLVLDRPVAQLPIRNENGTLKIRLPHGEHMIALQPDGAFRIQQGAGFVSVAGIDGRLLLKAGYHRSFAFGRAMLNEPDARAKCALVVLTRTLPPQLSPDFPHQGLRTMVRGSRPALLADFFDLNLAMTVRLRKRAYEMHLKMVPVDDP